MTTTPQERLIHALDVFFAGDDMFGDIEWSIHDKRKGKHLISQDEAYHMYRTLSKFYRMIHATNSSCKNPHDDWKTETLLFIQQFKS